MPGHDPQNRVHLVESDDRPPSAYN
jgi:hypothetical protein